MHARSPFRLIGFAAGLFAICAFALIPSALPAAPRSVDEKELDEQDRLLELPVLDLMDFKAHAALSNDARTLVERKDWYSSGRTPRSLALQHQAWDALGLKAKLEGKTQLEKKQAALLAETAGALRSNQLVALPGRDGGVNPPKITSPWDLRPFESVLRGLPEDQAPALVQMLQVEEEVSRQVLVTLLGRSKAPAASAALARQAIYDSSPGIRQAAIQALADRPAHEVRPILLDALRYPWPPAARRAAVTLVALKDRAALPQLQKLLDEPDPALPIQTEEELVVREVVRINHLRNCLLCHAVAVRGSEPVAALVPTPGKPLPAMYYGSHSGGDIFVRADVTYLRQDFSAMLPVENAKPWPAMQRFDFLVRTRPATSEEIAALAKRAPDASYPQREAVLFALNELTK